MTPTCKQYHQPAHEIPEGAHFYQRNGGTEAWTAATRDELLAELASPTPPAFRSILGTTAVDADGRPAMLQGALYADFDGDLDETCAKFREFLGKLQAHGVDLAQCRLFATGGRGFHVEIPQGCFLANVPAEGIADLHRIYKEMAMSLFVDTLDLRVYSVKRMWRVPGVKRSNGLYKVSLTVEEALAVTPDRYSQLCAQPRPFPALQQPVLTSGLASLFTAARAKVRAAEGRRTRTRAASQNFKRVTETRPATLEALFSGTARLKAGTGWNQVATQVALLALAAGLSEAETITRCRGLIDHHHGDGSRYASPQARERELRNQYRYLDGNPAYAPSLPAVMALLDQPAPDLVAAQQLLELPTFDPEPVTAAEPEPEQPEQGAYPLPYPGLMADTVASVLASATKPQPELTLMSVLLGMAAAIPGTFSLPNGLRLNLYAFGIAETGAGKDVPLRAARTVARQAGATCIGLPGSGEGLEDALPDSGSMLCDVDEIAHLLAAVNGAKAPPHLISLSGNMLRLFSASAGSYTTRALAKVKGKEPRTLQNPCMSVIGFSTPSTLGDKLKGSNISDGLLGRFLMARGRDRVEPQWTMTAPAMPYELDLMAERIRRAGADPVTITLNAPAERRLIELQRTLSRKGDDAADPMSKALLVRSLEKLFRVAGVLAVWDNPEAPTIELEHVIWASKLVEASDRAMLAFVDGHMHEGETQANAAKVKGAIQALLDRDPATLSKGDARYHEAGAVTRSSVLKRTKLSARDLALAVEHLVALDELVEELDDVPGGKGTNSTVRVLRTLQA